MEVKLDMARALVQVGDIGMWGPDPHGTTHILNGFFMDLSSVCFSIKSARDQQPHGPLQITHRGDHS